MEKNGSPTRELDSGSIFTADQVRLFAEKLKDNKNLSPLFSARFLATILKICGIDDKNNPDVISVKNDIKKFMENAGIEDLKEVTFRDKVQTYYERSRIVNTITKLGKIPKDPVEAPIGIGFIDIVEYTYLSRWLSPKENQLMLDGLYSAFNWVLEKNNGFLNKMTGDGMMFQFGGTIDPNVQNLNIDDTFDYIARSLFYTCIEIQKVCHQFNKADEAFLIEDSDPKTKKAMRLAFRIIHNLRENMSLVSSISEMFQIRIRVGANIGEASFGNWGPDGDKRWDAIGEPVIEASRMEATAPIGGLRISKALFTRLNKIGVVDEYFENFKREAEKVDGYYRDIKKKELFQFSKIILKDKKSAEYDTYSIQVDPGFPEEIITKTKTFLTKSEEGADNIIELLQYHRGKRIIVNAIEKLFITLGINIRKAYILRTIYPKKFEAFLRKLGYDDAKTEEYIDDHYSLFELFIKLGKYQDQSKIKAPMEVKKSEFKNYEQYINDEIEEITKSYYSKRVSIEHRTYFFNMVYLKVFSIIKTGILEYQNLTLNELME